MRHKLHLKRVPYLKKSETQIPEINGLCYKSSAFWFKNGKIKVLQRNAEFVITDNFLIVWRILSLHHLMGCFFSVGVVEHRILPLHHHRMLPLFRRRLWTSWLNIYSNTIWGINSVPLEGIFVYSAHGFPCPSEISCCCCCFLGAFFLNEFIVEIIYLYQKISCNWVSLRNELLDWIEPPNLWRISFQKTLVNYCFI